MKRPADKISPDPSQVMSSTQVWPQPATSDLEPALGEEKPERRGACRGFKTRIKNHLIRVINNLFVIKTMCIFRNIIYIYIYHVFVILTTEVPNGAVILS